MFKPRLNVSKGLFEKIRAAAAALGCASADEWVESVLEREAEQVLAQHASSDAISEEEVEDIAKKLEGLGYLK